MWLCNIDNLSICHIIKSSQYCIIDLREWNISVPIYRFQGYHYLLIYVYILYVYKHKIFKIQIFY